MTSSRPSSQTVGRADSVHLSSEGSSIGIEADSSEMNSTCGNAACMVTVLAKRSFHYHLPEIDLQSSLSSSRGSRKTRRAPVLLEKRSLDVEMERIEKDNDEASDDVNDSSSDLQSTKPDTTPPGHRDNNSTSPNISQSPSESPDSAVLKSSPLSPTDETPLDNTPPNAPASRPASAVSPMLRSSSSTPSPEVLTGNSRCSVPAGITKPDHPPTSTSTSSSMRSRNVPPPPSASKPRLAKAASGRRSEG